MRLAGDYRTDAIHDGRNEYQRPTIHGSDPKGVATERWRYGVGGTRRGPVGDAELRRLADAGTLRPTDLVWRAGMPDWVPADRAEASR